MGADSIAGHVMQYRSASTKKKFNKQRAARASAALLPLAQSCPKAAAWFTERRGAGDPQAAESLLQPRGKGSL
jgi:hypothetical protein